MDVENPSNVMLCCKAELSSAPEIAMLLLDEYLIPVVKIETNLKQQEVYVFVRNNDLGLMEGQSIRGFFGREIFLVPFG